MSRRFPTAAVSMLLAWASLAIAEPGDLDPTFGLAGRVTTAVDGVSASGHAVARQPDGRIVVGGTATGRQGTRLVVLARYDADGRLDPTFGGGDGVATFPGRGDRVTLTIQPDDRILVTTSDLQLGLLRFLPDGTPDPDFGDGGRVAGSILQVIPHAVIVRPDHKLLVAGAYVFERRDEEYYLLAVVQLHPDGRLDDTFGDRGRAITDVQGGLQDDSWADAILLQPDGKIVAVGGCGLGFALVRYDEHGARDPSFGSDGIVATPHSGNAHAVAWAGDRIVAAGLAYDSTHDALMIGYRTDGSLDPGFGTDGRVGTVLPDGTTAFMIRDLVRQPDGKLVASVATDTRRSLVRFAADGTFDCGFGTGGMAATGLGQSDWLVYPIGLALDDGGRILAAGTVGPPWRRVLALERHAGGDGDPRCDGREPRCGDGTADPGETCDDGPRNGTPLSCCTATCTATSDDATCDDGRPCTVDDRCHAGTCTGGAPRVCPACESCDPEAGCVVMPRSGCRRTLAPRHSVLALDPRGALPDRLRWRWRHGEATATPAFGDPQGRDAYSFCLYETSDIVPWLLVRATTTVGAQCAGRPCWRALPSGRHAYRDPAGTAGGLTEITLQPGGARRSHVTVRQSGHGIVPDLPLAPPLVAQLQGADGQCWETRHRVADVRQSGPAGLRAPAE